MNVLHVISSLRHGGAERLVTSLAPQLKARGIDVSVISLLDCTPLRGELIDAGIPTTNLGHEGTIYSVPGMARSFFRLRKAIAERSPDIIHSHLYLPDILSRLAAPRSCALMTTLHGQDPWWREPYRWRSRGKRWLDRSTGLARQVRYISVSKQVYDVASEALAIPSSKHRIIHNGINLSKFPAEQRQAHARPIIVQVGRFYPEKGHMTSLKALAIARQSMPDLHLRLVGEGPLRKELEQEVVRLGLTTSVTFAGLRDDVQAELASADIFWMPSEREGLPLACVEAMASGLPVVASAVGGLPELIEHARSGILVQAGAAQDLAKRTVELIEDRELAEHFSRNARATVERSFSLDMTVTRYEQAYRDLLQGRWS